jgi:hypothetical protein
MEGNKHQLWPHMTVEERRDLVRLVLAKVKIDLRTGSVGGLIPKPAFAFLFRVLAEEEDGLISVCAWRPRGDSESTRNSDRRGDCRRSSAGAGVRLRCASKAPSPIGTASLSRPIPSRIVGHHSDILGRRRARGKPPYAYVGVLVPFGVTPVCAYALYWCNTSGRNDCERGRTMALATSRLRATARWSCYSSPAPSPG